MAASKHVSTVRLFIALGVAGVTSMSAGAALGHAAEPMADGWTWRATSYGWLTWLDGTLVVRGREFDVDASAGDVLSALDFGLMGTIEGRRGPWSAWSDLVYADLGQSRDIVTSAAGGVAALAISADVRMTTVEAAVAYEIGTRSGYAHVDVYGGARYWAQRADVAFNISVATDVDGLEVSGTRAVARSGNVDWVDPLIGIRVRRDLPFGGEAFVRGDIGGFGAGSDFSWQAMAAVNWHLCDHDAIAWDTYLGYRALSVDYAKGSGSDRYQYDVTEHGPVIGVTGRF